MHDLIHVYIYKGIIAYDDLLGILNNKIYIKGLLRQHPDISDIEIFDKLSYVCIMLL